MTTTRSFLFALALVPTLGFAAPDDANVNTLTAAEKSAGWKLLFDGKSLTGWHNFKKDDVRPGWQVKDGLLVCADPHNAGDIVTTEQFGAFELNIDYNISEGGNSGIMFHVTDEGVDPKTGKILDATKPAGEWNHVRLVVTPEKCIHEINGVKYFEYVMGSDDFKERVAKSKFASMPLFAKAAKGYLALQGDHGSVSFRNIKVRPL